MGSIGIIVIYVVALGLMMYFLAIKPQKKQQKAQQRVNGFNRNRRLCINNKRFLRRNYGYYR